MRLYKIKKSKIDKKGHGLYATKNIKSGTKIINYKGKNIVEFIKFESDEEAKILIKDAAKFYKRSGLKERS